LTGELLLVVNPGSTSTKVALYRGETVVAGASLDHSGAPWATSREVIDQLPHRVRMVREFLKEHGIGPGSLVGIVARGGLLRPVRSGAYLVNEAMVADLRDGVGGRHAANLGGLIAWELSSEGQIPSFIVDAVSVDELGPEARLSGFPSIPRKSLLHALNIRACARRASRDLGRDLAGLYLVIAHLGGGFSICPFYRGAMRDVNNSNEEGPFTVERAGTLPALALLELWRRLGGRELKHRLTSRSGMFGYLGTKDARAVEKKAKEDRHTRVVWEGLAFGVAQEICAMAASYPEKLDAVVLTGGLANSADFVAMVREYTGFLGRHLVYPGEDEMEALSAGALRVLRGEETTRVYPETEVV
jgi:butyrate kinase